MVIMPDGKDFILDYPKCPKYIRTRLLNKKDENRLREELSKLNDKYQAYMRKGEKDSVHLWNDVYMSKAEYDLALNTDKNALLNFMLSMSGNCTVRHCYTPDGEPYYAVSNGTERRFVKSAYSLTLVGAAWSYYTWRILFFADAVLSVYLTELKEELGKTCPDFSMEIRPLYMNYIRCGLDMDQMDHFPDELPLEYEEIKETINAYLEKNKEYVVEAKDMSSCEWYNGKNNCDYYRLSEILDRAALEILKLENRGSLRGTGQEGVASKLRHKLLDMKRELRI